MRCCFTCIPAPGGNRKRRILAGCLRCRLDRVIDYVRPRTWPIMLAGNGAAAAFVTIVRTSSTP